MAWRAIQRSSQGPLESRIFVELWRSFMGPRSHLSLSGDQHVRPGRAEGRKRIHSSHAGYLRPQLQDTLNRSLRWSCQLALRGSRLDAPRQTAWYL